MEQASSSAWKGHIDTQQPARGPQQAIIDLINDRAKQSSKTSQKVEHLEQIFDLRKKSKVQDLKIVDRSKEVILMDLITPAVGLSDPNSSGVISDEQKFAVSDGRMDENFEVVENNLSSESKESLDKGQNKSLAEFRRQLEELNALTSAAIEELDASNPPPLKQPLEKALSSLKGVDFGPMSEISKRVVKDLQEGFVGLSESVKDFDSQKSSLSERIKQRMETELNARNKDTSDE